MLPCPAPPRRTSEIDEESEVLAPKELSGSWRAIHLQLRGAEGLAVDQWPHASSRNRRASCANGSSAQGSTVQPHAATSVARSVIQLPIHLSLSLGVRLRCCPERARRVQLAHHQRMDVRMCLHACICSRAQQSTWTVHAITRPICERTWTVQHLSVTAFVRAGTVQGVRPFCSSPAGMVRNECGWRGGV